MDDEPYDAVVLAGGGGRRMGGGDKPGLVVGGRTLLAGVLAAVDDARVVVVVGPPRALGSRVVQVREHPPGGGPAAALAVGLTQVGSPWTAVLAADLPDLDGRTVLALRRAAAGRDGALLVDDDGRDQVLTGVWSTARLRAAAAGRDLAGSPLRVLLQGLAPARVPTSSLGLHGWADCDSPADLTRARARAIRPGDEPDTV